MSEMGQSTQGVWKALGIPGCCPQQDCCHDCSRRVRAELVGEHHPPNEQYGASLLIQSHPCRAEEEEIQSYKEQAKYLAGPIALLKMCATQTAQDTARDAVQIFGGRGITRTGMGRFIEHVSGRSCHFTSSRGLMITQYHRTITFDSLLGGAEDVLGDLGVRQALRAMPSNAKL